MKEQHALVAEIVPFLLSRGYARNERAPSERELAERFRAGRPQVREALSVVGLAGMVLPMLLLYGLSILAAKGVELRQA